MFKIHKEELEVNGKKLTLETGRVARQADGAIIATLGETVVIATAVALLPVPLGLDIRTVGSAVNPVPSLNILILWIPPFTNDVIAEAVEPTPDNDIVTLYPSVAKSLSISPIPVSIFSSPSSNISHSST